MTSMNKYVKIMSILKKNTLKNNVTKRKCLDCGKDHEDCDDREYHKQCWKSWIIY